MKRQRADAPLSPNPRSPTTSSSSALQTSNEQQQQLHLQGGGKVLVMPGFPGDNHVPKSEMYRIGVVLPPYSERDKYVWLHVGRARTKIVNCALLKFLIPLLPGGLMSATVKETENTQHHFGFVCNYNAGCELYTVMLHTGQRRIVYKLYTEAELVDVMWRRPSTDLASMEHCVAFAQHGIDAVCKLWPDLDVQQEHERQRCTAAQQVAAAHQQLAAARQAAQQCPPPTAPVVGVPVLASSDNPAPQLSIESVLQLVAGDAMAQRAQLHKEYEEMLHELPHDGPLVPGVPEGMLRRLLEAYYQIHRSSS